MTYMSIIIIFFLELFLDNIYGLKLNKITHSMFLNSGIALQCRAGTIIYKTYCELAF